MSPIAFTPTSSPAPKRGSVNNACAISTKLLLALGGPAGLFKRSVTLIPFLK